MTELTEETRENLRRYIKSLDERAWSYKLDPGYVLSPNTIAYVLGIKYITVRCNNTEQLTWCVRKFGNGSERWFIFDYMIYFLNEADYSMYILRWG